MSEEQSCEMDWITDRIIRRLKCNMGCYEEITSGSWLGESQLRMIHATQKAIDLIEAARDMVKQRDPVVRFEVPSYSDPNNPWPENGTKN